MDSSGGATSRRRFLAGAALGAAGLAVGAAGGGAEATAAAEPAGSSTEPFYGTHQAGIATAAQEHLVFASFDLIKPLRHEVRDLLSRWSADAARMAAGESVGPTNVATSPPADTGETLGLSAARLTITVGFGPTFFDRLQLRAKRPAALVDLPPFPGDQLDSARTGGDLCVQACADDPQVAFHAIRNLARIAEGTAMIRWMQHGFGRTPSTSQPDATPRNLMGFKDGTRDISPDNIGDMRRYVWVGDDTDQSWMRGGSYLVARRIRMLIEKWDEEDLSEQQRVFGRAKDSGAPLGGTNEFDAPNLTATGPDGALVIDAAAHIRLASPSSNGGMKILRRGYGYADGNDRTGQIDAGLFFVAFQNNPHRQFVRIQQRLAANDALSEYIRHTGSAIFAVPPGLASSDDWYGRALLG